VITGDGDVNGSGEWAAGLVDRGSFLKDSFSVRAAAVDISLCFAHSSTRRWAKTVVCGRARIGGIPVGLIAAQAVTRNSDIAAGSLERLFERRRCATNVRNKQFNMKGEGQGGIAIACVRCHRDLYAMVY